VKSTSVLSARAGHLFEACAILLFAASLTTLTSAQAGKVEPIGAAVDPAIPASIQQTLATKGDRLTLDSSGPVELWFCKTIPSHAKDAAADAVYDRLVPSSLIGVLHFPSQGSDYRGQSITPGFYTLRYALMPNDGNHLGVAPSRDFLLLIPVKADPGSDSLPKNTDLIALSSQTAGTKHPAPLSLVPAEAGSASGIAKDGEGHSIFATTLHLASGEEMPFALVVKGTAPQ
jgi:hypothetical protein